MHTESVSLRWRLPRRFLVWLVVVYAGCNVSVLFATDVLFKKHVINADLDFSAAALIDVNHDGEIDIVCGSHWYEAPDWEEHFVAEVPRIGGRPDGFSHLEFDVNRDGWQDVITVNYRSRSIRWMEHPGPIILQNESAPWTSHLVAKPGAMETGRLVDVDGDGNVDLLPNGAKFAAWWEFKRPSETNGHTEWIRHELPDDVRGHGLGFGDIVWCSAHGFGVYWLEQTVDSQGNRVWTRHAIDTSWSQGYAPLWADLDGDGRNELIAGKRYMSHAGKDPGAYDPMIVYRYQFSPATRTWDRWVVSEAGQRVGLGLDPKFADIDADGDLDLLASGRSGLYWLENCGPRKTRSDKSLTATSLQALDAKLISRLPPKEQWGIRRYQSVARLEKSIGEMPATLQRIPLDTHIQSTHREGIVTQDVRFRSNENERIAATLIEPAKQSDSSGWGIVIAKRLSGDSASSMKLAGKLAEAGHVCLLVELELSIKNPTFRKAVWNTMRAADLLQACPNVVGERICLIADAPHGQSALLTAAIDPRLVITITDLPPSLVSGTPNGGPNGEAREQLHDAFASIPPRLLKIGAANLASAAKDFTDSRKAAEAGYRLFGKDDRLQTSTASVLDPESINLLLKTR